MRIPMYIVRRNWLRNEEQELARLERELEKAKKTNSPLVPGYEHMVAESKKFIADIEKQIEHP